MSTPTDSSRDELAALRERAYGRDADILDDPAALARLSELEELAAAASAATIAASAARARIPTNGGSSRRPAVEVDGEDPEEPAVIAAPSEGMDAASPAAPGTSGQGGDDVPAPANEGLPEDGLLGGAGAADAASGAGEDAVDAEAAEVTETAAVRPWWRRVPVLWAASVVAAMLVGAGLTLLVQGMEAGKVGVLQVDTEADWPEEVWGGPTEDSLAFEDFYGLSVLSQPQVTGDGTQAAVPCLIVFSGVSDNPSYLGGSCGAGSFPAEAALVVGRQAPSELRDRFPEGTALQFVLDGEQVHVYAREPGIVDQTP